MIGCEIWVKLGGPQDSPSSFWLANEEGAGGWRPECQFLATDSHPPYTANGVYPDEIGNGGEANQTVHFIGRWMSTRNEPGPLPAPPNEVRETKSGRVLASNANGDSTASNVVTVVL